MQAISFVARRGAGMAEHGLFLESSEASSFLVLGNQDISINMARHSVAGYVRSGNDLILNLSDGREIGLENYFGATGSDANRLFLSSNGLIEQVAFEFGPDGSVYPMYQGAESWGKWGPSQDLVFYEEPSPIGIADAATGYVDVVSADTFKDENSRRVDGDPHYKVRIIVDRDNLTSRQARIEIRPGMQAQAELQTGAKSVLQYLLKPLYKSKDALRER